MPNANEVLEKTQEYIGCNLNGSLSVKVIAAEMHVDPADLERIFRRATGTTIKKYIDARLKSEIVKRMENMDCKGCALAQELGFKTDQAFYRWVARVFNMRFKELSLKCRCADLANSSIKE
jgi:methylphosphotriester-DNA--protein-cysteine methyltransferase